MAQTAQRALRDRAREVERLLRLGFGRLTLAYRALRGAPLDGVARRAYEASSKSRRTAGWHARAVGPNAAVAAAGQTARDRARDLVRNDPHGARAVRTLVTRTIGTGIRLRVLTESRDLNDEVLWWWDRFCRQCSISDDLTFYGLQALGARAMFESGEVLFRRRRRRLDDESLGEPLLVPLQLQVLEADHLDGMRTEVLTGRAGARVGRIVQGVEFDALDRRVAYWLHSEHPGDAHYHAGALFSDSVRVDADAIAHVYEALRPGQVRGVPWLAPVIRALRDLGDYADAERLRKKLEACLMAFVMTDEVAPDPGRIGADAQDTDLVTDNAGNPLDQLEPGTIAILRGGKDVRMNAPASVGGYAEYKAAELRAIAAGAGVTYEQLAADLSRTNYSSYRAGNLEFRAMVEALQYELFVPLLCEPVWRWFLEAAILAGRIPDRDYPVEWAPPRYEDVDRVKEAKADLVELRSGTVSLREVIARKGYDPDEVLRDIARTNALLDELGISLDSDPRKTAASGTAQDYLREREGIETTSEAGPEGGS